MKMFWYFKYSVLMLSLFTITLVYNNCSNDATFDLSEGVESLETFNGPNNVENPKQPSITINNNSEFTREALVNLSLAPNRITDQMFISDSSDCKVGSWESFKDNKSWTLKKVNQSTSVYVKYRYQDEPESDCVKDDIIHDDIPPAVSFNQNISSWVAEANLNISFSVDDFGSGVKTIECDKDGSGLYQNCGKNIFYNSMLENKNYILVVRSTDNAGNRSLPKQLNWQSDQTAPTVTFNITPSSMTSDTTPRFTFVGTDLGSGIASYECRVDQNQNYTICQNDLTLSALQDGSHQISVRATDHVGRVSQPISYQWMQDSTAPTIEFTQTPKSIENIKTAIFGFAGINAAQGITSYDCKIDMGAYAQCVSPVNLSNLNDGNHVFSVIGSDAVGNRSAAISYSWQIDSQKPTIQFTRTPNAIASTNTAQFSFSAQDLGSGIKEIQCRLDSASFAACSSSHNLSNISSGQHTLEARAVDNAGNVSDVINYSWIYDNSPPTVTITSTPLNPTKLSTGSFSFTANDGAGSGIDRIECRIDGGTFNQCTSPSSFANLTDGEHKFYIRAYDRAGNVSSVQSYEWLIDLKAPNLDFILRPEAIVYLSEEAKIRFTADDGNGSGNLSYQCQYNGSNTPCTGDVTYSYLMSSEANYTFTVQVMDAVGNSTTKSLSWQSIYQAVPKEYDLKVNPDRPVDILFVVDISSSMNQERSNLAQKIDGFLNQIVNLDWQLAVTSTDVVGNRDFEDGRLTNFATQGGATPIHILDSSMDISQAQSLFGARVQGIPNGDGNERGILATVRVIQRALDGKGSNAINAEFLRPGADFAVVILSDEDENSSGTNVAYGPQQFLDFFNASFTEKKNLTWHSIVTRSGDVACKNTGYSYYGVNYETLSQLTGYGQPGGAIIGSVCATDYTSQLSKIGESVKDMQRSISLGCSPFDSDGDGVIEMSVQFQAIGATSYSAYSAPFVLQGQKIIFDDFLPIGDYKFNFNCTK